MTTKQGLQLQTGVLQGFLVFVEWIHARILVFQVMKGTSTDVAVTLVEYSSIPLKNKEKF